MAELVVSKTLSSNLNMASIVFGQRPPLKTNNLLQIWQDLVAIFLFDLQPSWFIFVCGISDCSFFALASCFLTYCDVFAPAI